MHNIVMLGMQGSGKGTQADLISLRLGIPAISVGKLFRAEIEKQTGLGRVITKFVERGEMVPSDITVTAVEERIMEEDADYGYILDGFPRNITQAEQFSKFVDRTGHELCDVVYIKISDEEALRRLSGRRVCSNKKCEMNYHAEFNPPKKDANKCDRCGSGLVQRGDDVPEAIARRIALFHQETEPLVEFYRNRGVLREIDGERPIGEVEQTIMASLDLEKKIGGMQQERKG